MRVVPKQYIQESPHSDADPRKNHVVTAAFCRATLSRGGGGRVVCLRKIPTEQRPKFMDSGSPTWLSGFLQAYCGWTKLRNPFRTTVQKPWFLMLPLMPTNNGFPMVSKRCRSSSIHSMILRMPGTHLPKVAERNLNRLWGFHFA